MRIPEGSIFHKLPVNWELITVPNMAIITLIVLFWVLALTVVWQAINPTAASTGLEGGE
jgi:hypothetical protein